MFPRGRFGVSARSTWPATSKNSSRTTTFPTPARRRSQTTCCKQTGTYRIARGGSFARFADLARTRRRHGHYQRQIYAMGFRIAEDP